MRSRKFNIGIMGATGMVGQRFIQMLENHPWFNISSLMASEKSEGKKYAQAAKWYLPGDMPPQIADMVVEKISSDTVKNDDLDIVFSAVPSEIALEAEASFASDVPVFSNTSTYRMMDDVPLMIPEVNPEHLGIITTQKKNRGWDGFIVTNPNCTTIGFALPLKPLMDAYGLKNVNIASMQALSGAGYDGVPSMAIIDNLIPFIKNEEKKAETEPLKILGKFNKKDNSFYDADFNIFASCNRVPVLDGHTISVFVETNDDFEIGDVCDVMKNFKGEPQDMKLPSAPKNPLFVMDGEDYEGRPQPRMDRDRDGGMAVSIGRLRKNRRCLKFTCVSHNTIRGAAGASILNAELAIRKGLIEG